MSTSSNDIESQIDLFLEHVKRTATRAMEDRGNDGWLNNENLVHSIIKRSRSGMSTSDDGTVQSSVKRKLRNHHEIVTRLMEGTESKSTGELLQTVLSMQKLQDVQVNEINCWQETDESLHRQDQMIWQIETNGSSRQSVVETNNSPVLQHLPITYIATGNQNIIFSKGRKPVTYIVSQNLSENEKSPKSGKGGDVFLQDPQKLVVVQPVDGKLDNSIPAYANLGQMTVNYVGAKVYKVDGKGSVYYATADSAETDKPDDGGCQEVKEDAYRITKDDVDEEEMKSPGENQPMDDEAKQQSRDGNCSGDDISVDDVKISQAGGDNKTRKISKCKVERKIVARKKRLKRRKVNVKNKLKSSKKVDKKFKRETSAESSDDKKEKCKVNVKRNLDELTKLEERAEQVAERFKIGCECVDYNCFEGLNPEKVFRHRLNIADLTKAEHDMYLMGVIMTSMQNPDETCRHKERLRIRSTYVYQGKRVCLTAFLYLEHVTLYQMKRLRKHLKYHGVSPRIHGNRGRKPANTLSLDTYQHTTLFVQRYIEKHCVKSVPNFTTFSSNKPENPFVTGANLNLHEARKTGKEPHTIKVVNKMNSYHLPPDCTKKTLHEEYKAFCEGIRPDHKIMQYSTFTSFLKKQFPNVKFQKVDKKQEDKPGTEGKSSGSQASTEKCKPKVKKLRKSETKNDVAEPEDTAKRGQKVFVPGRTIQIAPATLSVAPKQSGQAFIAKGQIIGNAVIKAPQIVINGQHMQICSAPTQIQSDGRVGEHFIVGNQLVNVGHAPTYTQRVYTINNISNS